MSGQRVDELGVVTMLKSTSDCFMCGWMYRELVSSGKKQLSLMSYLEGIRGE